MNDKQRVVTATFVTALFIAAIFFIPWQRTGTDDIRWAPFYQNPITYESTFDGSAVTNRFAAMKGKRMYGLYVVQIFCIAAAGTVTYFLVRDTK